MVLLSQEAVALWMNFVVADVAVEYVLVLAREAKFALVAGQGAHIILVDAVLLRHDIQANADTLPDHLDARTALVAGVHFPGLLLLPGPGDGQRLLFGE